MAATNWRTGHDLTAVIASREMGWNFLQLVRLLLRIGQQFDDSSDSAMLDALSNGVHFQGSLQADYPPGEVRRVDFKPGVSPVRVTAVDCGLIGSNGPLPEPFITWIKSLDDNGDSAMKDFINLFGNRLLALRYLIGRSTRPAMLDVPAAKTYSGQLLTALTGRLADSEKRDHWNPAWDLGAAGLFANQRLSLPVARYLLKFSLGLRLVAINAMQGGWLHVDKQDYSRLESKGPGLLGRGAALGRKVWDQHKGMELEIGPVSWQQLRQLIPGGKRHAELRAVVHRITDRRFDCKVTFIWPREEIPLPELGKGQGAGSGVLALGYTATLAGKTDQGQPGQPLKTGFTIALED